MGKIPSRDPTLNSRRGYYASRQKEPHWPGVLAKLIIGRRDTPVVITRFEITDPSFVTKHPPILIDVPKGFVAANLKSIPGDTSLPGPLKRRRKNQRLSGCLRKSLQRRNRRP
jgi:hypothetical protein